MGFKWKYLWIIPIVIAAFAVASFYEDEYVLLIRKLYVAFTDGKISFVVRKEFHFASYAFAGSFAVFCIWLSFWMIWKPSKRNLFYVIISVALFFVSTAVIACFNSNAELINCTMCQGGRKKLYSLKCDSIFMASIAIAAIGFTVAKLKFDRIDFKKEN
ncbi:hypothetical protein [Mucilaginibacter gilvus]|uniref:Uncharacterized protein n=1 Tax=Mucilaginibacter gilvus TaxID=2305909 RepID=A0A444MU82_9SPHI|nr:hypothetical protein [Mucilaginibacter gilvus]RWY57196.1 hypothetical protein EPL05_01285 [Mucilaginibacter gilvus]